MSECEPRDDEEADDPTRWELPDAAGPPPATADRGNGPSKLPPIPNARVNENGVFTVRENDQDHFEEARLDFFDVLFPRKSISWLWPDYIPLEKVTLLDGVSGTGKSFVGLDIAARVSRGAPWPGRVQGPQLAGHVLLLCSEDGRDDTLHPRLESMRADLNRFICLSGVRSWKFGGPPDRIAQRRIRLPGDLPHLEFMVRSVRGTRLVLIDPLSDYCLDPRLVAATLQGLSELAERCGVAVVVITRPVSRRTAEYKPPTLARSYDSARCVYQMLTDPSDETHAGRCLLPVRMNFCAAPEVLPFSITSGILAWGEPGELSPGLAALLGSASEKASVLREVMEWIRAQLTPGDEPVASMHKQARECGYSSMTLRRARKALGVRTYQSQEVGSRIHFWSIRPEGSEDNSPGSANGHPHRGDGDPLAAALGNSDHGRQILGEVLHGNPALDEQSLARLLAEYERHMDKKHPRDQRS